MCAHLCPASSTRALTQRPGSQGGDMNEAFIQKWEPSPPSLKDVQTWK